MTELRQEIARVLRAHIKVDATGLAPSVASAFVVGVEDAADALLPFISKAEQKGAEKAGKIINAAGKWYDNLQDDAWTCDMIRNCFVREGIVELFHAVRETRALPTEEE